MMTSIGGSTHAAAPFPVFQISASGQQLRATGPALSTDKAQDRMPGTISVSATGLPHRQRSLAVWQLGFDEFETRLQTRRRQSLS